MIFGVWVIKEGLSYCRVYSFGFPANLLRKPSQLLIKIQHIKHFILFLLVIPIFTVLTHFYQCIYLVTGKWIIFEFLVICLVKLAYLGYFIVD